MFFFFNVLCQQSKILFEGVLWPLQPYPVSDNKSSWYLKEVIFNFSILSINLSEKNSKKLKKNGKNTILLKIKIVLTSFHINNLFKYNTNVKENIYFIFRIMGCLKFFLLCDFYIKKKLILGLKTRQFNTSLNLFYSNNLKNR